MRLAMKLSYTIDIKNTPEKVFYWLGDPERATVWMSSVSKTEMVHETPDMVGTTFREVVEEDGQGTELEGVVTDYRPNQRIAFHLNGKYNVVDVEYCLEGIENHTRLTQKAEVRFKGLLKVLSVVMGAGFKKKALEQSQKEFAKLKELCEEGLEAGEGDGEVALGGKGRAA
jgi:carbon monoxide dehydrogenase subunit G